MVAWKNDKIAVTAAMLAAGCPPCVKRSLVNVLSVEQNSWGRRNDGSAPIDVPKGPIEGETANLADLGHTAIWIVPASDIHHFCRRLLLLVRCDRQVAPSTAATPVNYPIVGFGHFIANLVSFFLALHLGGVKIGLGLFESYFQHVGHAQPLGFFELHKNPKEGLRIRTDMTGWLASYRCRVAYEVPWSTITSYQLDYLWRLPPRITIGNLGHMFP